MKEKNIKNFQIKAIREEKEKYENVTQENLKQL